MPKHIVVIVNEPATNPSKPSVKLTAFEEPTITNITNNG